MFLEFLIFALISMCTCTNVSFMNECYTANNLFVATCSEFVKCVMDNNVEASFCENCLPKYEPTIAAYTALTSDQKCRSMYVTNNQLNLVEILYANTMHYWDLGVCSDCYEDCDFSKDVNQNCKLSNQTKEFMKQQASTDQCIEDSVNKQIDPCVNCTENYEKLNEMYNAIRLKTSDKFCFDIKDKMNKTRIQWTDLHCCKDRISSPVEFLTLSSFSLFIATAFYMGTYLIGVRKQRIQHIPDDLIPPADQEQSNGIMNINVVKPSTSESSGDGEPEIKKIINNDLDDSMSSDEDILLTTNPNLIEI